MPLPARTEDLQPPSRRTKSCRDYTDRKNLADLAVTDEATFKSIVDQAKSALEDKAKSKKKAA